MCLAAAVRLLIEEVIACKVKIIQYFKQLSSLLVFAFNDNYRSGGPGRKDLDQGRGIGERKRGLRSGPFTKKMGAALGSSLCIVPAHLGPGSYRSRGLSGQGSEKIIRFREYGRSGKNRSRIQSLIDFYQIHAALTLAWFI